MKRQSGKPVKKLADDQIDLQDLDQAQPEEEEEEEEEDADDEVIPEVKEDEIEAVGGDDEEECQDCEEDGSDDADADDADDGAGDEETDAEDEIPDVGEDEVQPVDTGDEEEEDADLSFKDWADQEASEDEHAGEEDVEDPDADDEADAEDEIPDVSEDEVQPVDTGDGEEEEEEEEEDADADEEVPAPVPAPAADPVPAPAPAGEEDEEEEDAEDGDEVLDDDGDEDGDEADSCMDKGASAKELVIEPIFEMDADSEIKAANLSMQLFNPDSKDPHWVVFNNGDPLCKIALSAQPDAEDVRESFVSDGYAGSLLESIRELSTAEAPVSPIAVLAALPAKFYYAAVQKSKLAQTIKTEVTKEISARIAGANDDYNEKLMDNMGLVVGYQAKNLYKEPDPFKVRLVQSIKKAGVDQDVAVAIVEEAFLNEVPEWHQRVVAKAKEYCTYTPESLREIKAALGDAGQKQVDYDSILEREEKRTVVANTTKNRKPSAGIPLESYLTRRNAGTNQAGDETAEFKSRIKSGISGLRSHGRRS